MAPTHILLIPTRHIPDILHITAMHGDLLGRLFTLAAQLAREEGIAADGFRLVSNSGPAAGQTVPHLHFHLLGGRTLDWPPG
jgi:histidine triad (HIT) family protein